MQTYFNGYGSGDDKKMSKAAAVFSEIEIQGNCVAFGVMQGAASWCGGYQITQNSVSQLKMLDLSKQMLTMILSSMTEQLKMKVNFGNQCLWNV